MFYPLLIHAATGELQEPGFSIINYRPGPANSTAKHLKMLQQVLTGLFRLLRHLVVPKAMPRTDRGFPCNKVRHTHTHATSLITSFRSVSQLGNF